MTPVRTLGLILLGALALRMFFYHGFTASDDLAYHQHADALRKGTYRLTDPHMDLKGLRFGLLLPLAALKSLFPAPVASGILTLGASLASIAMIFHLGRRLLSERAGLVAAGLMAAAPLDIQMATSLFPESPATAVMLGSLLCFLRATPRSAAAAGLLAGAALLVKENTFFWWPFFAWWAWRKRFPVRVWIPAAAALLAFGLSLLLFYGLAAGTPFYQKQVIDGEYAGELGKMWYPTPGAILRRILIGLPDLLFNPAGFSGPAYGFYFALALPAAWITWREAGARSVLAMGILMALMFNFFPARFLPYLPNTILHRYLQPLLIPAVLLIGAAAAARPRPARWIAAPLSAALLLGAWILHADTAAANSVAFRAASRFHATGGTLHTDNRTAGALRYHLGEGPDIRVMPESTPRPGDFVLVNLQYLRRDLEFWGTPIPPCFENPGPSWRLETEFIPRYRRSLRRSGWGWEERVPCRGLFYRVD